LEAWPLPVQALFDGGGGEREQRHAGLCDCQAEDAAQVRHCQGRLREARCGEDVLKRDEIRTAGFEHGQ